MTRESPVHSVRPSSALAPPRATLQRKCACGARTSDGGTCGKCSSTAGTLQRKLSIGASDDRYEREADTIAAQVMARSPSDPASQAPLAIQRLAVSDGGGTGDAPASVSRTLAEGGQPLDRAIRADMEGRFGHDFSQVRLHSGGAAAQSARDVDARAYTVGNHIVYGEGQSAPHTSGGAHLLAHELAHVVQQGGAEVDASRGIALQRTPSAPRRDNDDRADADRSKVNVSPISDIDASPGAANNTQTATVKFNDPAIVHLSWELYDSTDNLVDGFSTMPTSKAATTDPFPLETANIISRNMQGRCLLRCVGRDATHQPVSYADQLFFVWRVKPTGTAPDIVALEAKKKALDATVKPKSGAGFSEVGKSFAELKDVNHDLGVLKTGTGTHVGNQCSVQPNGAIPTDCTNIVMEVLENTFTQQGRAADWLKVKTKMMANTKLGGRSKMSGVDLQAALQSEAGWKGIFWAPDPTYQIPKKELSGANSDEASFASIKAKKSKTYYKDNPKKGYPGLTIDHSVTDYAPEQPRSSTEKPSTTTKTTAQLDKLKKLPFGVLAAHGGYHMTLIMNGKVLEVHWSLEATNLDLIQETDLETWAVGPNSGFHYYASGAIVAPAADVDAAFK